MEHEHWAPEVGGAGTVPHGSCRRRTRVAGSHTLVSAGTVMGSQPAVLGVHEFAGLSEAPGQRGMWDNVTSNQHRPAPSKSWILEPCPLLSPREHWGCHYPQFTEEWWGPARLVTALGHPAQGREPATVHHLRAHGTGAGSERQRETSHIPGSRRWAEEKDSLSRADLWCHGPGRD